MEIHEITYDDLLIIVICYPPQTSYIEKNKCRNIILNLTLLQLLQPEIDAMVDCICTHGKAKNLLSLFEESLQKFLSKGSVSMHNDHSEVLWRACMYVAYLNWAGINKKSKRTQQKTSAGCSMSPAVAVHVCKRILVLWYLVVLTLTTPLYTYRMKTIHYAGQPSML